MTIGPGARLGPYEVTALLGEGGMGKVWRAHHTALKRDDALKVLPDEFAVSPDRLARFRREAQVLASLNHPNIAHVYGLEPSDPSTGSGQAGVQALVMELVEGPTLADRIAQGPIPVDEALPIAKQIAEALEAAHEQGIIHRDLKPANIKVRPDGTVKVLDFGLAKAMEPLSAGGIAATAAPTISSPAMMTGVGMLLGTAAYMSPEQARGKVVDRRTDIWAFGCVLFEMLTGKRAFDGEETTEVLARVIEREPDFKALPRPTPPAIRRLLRRTLEKDRKRRLADASDARLEIDEASMATPAEITSANAPLTRGRDRITWALGAMAVLAIAALAIPATLYVRRATPEAIVTRLDVVTPPTSDAYSFALSPDGRQLVFVANGERGSQLWLRPLDQVRAQPIAGTEGALFPFWAPDGRAVGFFAAGKLKRVGLTGAALQVLADAPYPRGGTWSGDGSIVFAPSVADPLLRIAATGGATAPVTRLAPGQTSHRWPQFLPDGRRFLFMVTTGRQETNGIYVSSVDGGEPTHVMPAETAAMYAPPGYLLLVSQGVLAAYPFDAARATVRGEPIPVAQGVGTNDGGFHSAFSVSARGVLAYRGGTGARGQLVWIDRTGKMVGTVGELSDENSPGNLALAPDGQRVGIGRIVQGNVDVWLIDGGRGVPTRFTFDAAADNAAVWSPDGSQVVFRSSRNGVHDLFVKAASGTADEQPLLVNSQGKGPLDWSQDGRFLLYGTQDPKTGSDLWVLPMMGERKPFAVLQSSFNEMEGQFSPDGRWLAYASDESGRYEICARAFPEASGKWLVSVAGGVERWRRDGRELYYVAPDARLMAVPIRLAPDTHAFDNGPPVPLFSRRLATGSNIAPAGFLARAQYAVASDGRFLMLIAGDAADTSPITIVQHWDQELKRLESTN
jgi:Tol biopolymer transport system component